MTRAFALTAFLAVLFAMPLLVLVLYAFASGWSFPEVIPGDFDLRSWRYLLFQWHQVALALLSSCGYSLLAIGVTFLLTLAPARVFARQEFRGKHLLEGMLLAPALLPPMTFAMGAHTLFLMTGLADTFSGVVLILSLHSYPYMLRALTAGYQAFSPTLGLCASNLGASPLRILLTVELPLLLPALVAGGTIVFLVTFSEYFLVFLIGGGTVPSYSGFLVPLLTSSDKSVASLLTLLFVLVPIGLFVVVDRVLVAVYRRRGLLSA